MPANTVPLRCDCGARESVLGKMLTLDLLPSI